MMIPTAEELKRRRETPTLLTAELSPEQQKMQAEIDLDWKRYRILLDIAYEHYTSVDTKADLAKLTVMVVQISEDYTGDKLERIPDRGRHRLLGELIEKAVVFDRSRESRGTTPVSNKQTFRSLVRVLINEAHSREHAKNKEDQTRIPTAYEVVSDILYKYGITNDGKKYSSKTIANW